MVVAGKAISVSVLHLSLLSNSEQFAVHCVYTVCCVSSLSVQFGRISANGDVVFLSFL